MDKKSFAAFSDTPIKVEYFNAKTPITMASFHYHNQYELYYSIKGERYYFIKDKCYALKTGSMVFINEYDIHYTAARANSSYERMVINFKKDYLKDVFANCDIDLFACFKKDVNIIEFDASEQQFIERLLSNMLTEFQENKNGSQEYLKACLVQILITINRKCQNTPDAEVGYINSTHKTISEISGYINNNYSEDITLKTIADKFFISPCYFSRVYKKFTGLSFIDYLNSVRIKEAQKLLRNSNFSIINISEKVGFKNQTHFGRIFKKISGVSPLDYRKKYKVVL